MSEVSLKIEIAGKEYPLKVTKDNATYIEKASIVIKNNLSDFEKKYKNRFQLMYFLPML